MKLSQFIQSYVDIVDGDYSSLDKAISERLEYASTHFVPLPDDPPRQQPSRQPEKTYG